jgi:hypothetical protein
MIHQKLFIVALPALLFAIFGIIPAKPWHKEGIPVVKISIEQNGQKYDINNNTVVLSPSPFDIVFEFSEPMNVLINASFNPKTLKLAADQQPISHLPGFSETGIAEGLFNEDKEIFISENAPNCWFFDDESRHRFNITSQSGSIIIGKRTIENLYNLDEKSVIKVTENKKTIFLVFIFYKIGIKPADLIELQRYCLKIKWEK